MKGKAFRPIVVPFFEIGDRIGTLKKETKVKAFRPRVVPFSDLGDRIGWLSSFLPRRRTCLFFVFLPAGPSLLSSESRLCLFHRVPGTR